MKSLVDTFKLANEIGIPCVGFGTWQIKDGQDAVDAVTKAIQLGYRHIDTASIYGNEASVGTAIRNCGVPRSELFITSKLWNSNKTYDQALQAFDESMKKLKLDVLDLYLIHWPSVKHIDANWERTNSEKWRALERLYQEGRIRAIGVSNVLPHHLQPLMERAAVMPMVNQLEIHPGHPQTETVAFCKAHGILAEAWSPLACGKILEVPELKAIAASLSKTPAQLCLRWCIQNGVLPLPKSVSTSRMSENAALFDFAISPEDMQTLNNLPPCGGACLNPDERNF